MPTTRRCTIALTFLALALALTPGAAAAQTGRDLRAEGGSMADRARERREESARAAHADRQAASRDQARDRHESAADREPATAQRNRPTANPHGEALKRYRVKDWFKEGEFGNLVGLTVAEKLGLFYPNGDRPSDEKRRDGERHDEGPGGPESRGRGSSDSRAQPGPLRVTEMVSPTPGRSPQRECASERCEAARNRDRRSPASSTANRFEGRNSERPR